MRVIIEDSCNKCQLIAAEYLVQKINAFQPSKDNYFKLVLPNPEKSVLIFFSKLAACYRAGEVSFKWVMIFQIEEKLGVSSYHSESRGSALYEMFLKHVDVEPENVFFLKGDSSNFELECELFENMITKLGGIDFVCVEVDPEGSIGANVPGSSFESLTRRKTRTDFVLHDRSFTRPGMESIDSQDSLVDSKHTSGKGDLVTLNQCLTMGLGTLMQAREIVALFLGSKVARALHHCLEGPVSNMFPASILQLHEKACIITDSTAKSTLRFTSIDYFTKLVTSCNEAGTNLTRSAPTNPTPYIKAQQFNMEFPDALSLENEIIALSPVAQEAGLSRSSSFRVFPSILEDSHLPNF